MNADIPIIVGRRFDRKIAGFARPPKDLLRWRRSAGSVPAVFGQEMAEQRRAMASTLVGSGNDR